MEYFTYLTNECNLHCAYCSVLLDCQQSNLPIRPTYSIDNYLRFIDTIQFKLDDNEINIYFFGGEPSLEYRAAQDLIAAIQAHFGDNYQVNFILHTNGILLNTIPSKLLDDISLIMFSINYEKIPKYNLASTYFQTIIDNSIELKLKKNIPIIARLTISEQTSLYTEIMLISHYFDLIYWQIENCDKFSNFNKFYDTYTYEVSLVYKVWFDYFEQGTLLKFVPFMAVVKFMLFHDRSDEEFSCGYRKGMIYIQTNGNCYSCSDNVEAGKHYIGNLHNGIEMLPIFLSELKCAKCLYRTLCMGRCGRMHVEFEDSHIAEYCALNQHMFDLFLSDRDRLSSAVKKYPYYESELSSALLEYTEFTP